MHYLVLFAAGVTRNVDIFEAFVYDVRAEMIELVYDPVYAPLVAGYGGSRNDYGVVVADREGGIFLVCHSRQRAHGFALAARAYDDELVVPVIFYLGNVDDDALGNVDFTYLFSRFDDVKHAPAVERHPAPELDGEVYYLLKAVNVGGKGCNNQPPRRIFGKQPVESSAYDRLAHRIARTLDIGAFAEI